MFNEDQIEKINEFLEKKISIIFDFKFNGLLLLFGSAVKDIIMCNEINDLDFIVLTQNDSNIIDFLNKYKLIYKKNTYKGYNFTYNNINIDISSTDDLWFSGHLSTDRLFYDIKRKCLIPIGIKQTLNKNQIIDYYYQGYFKPKKRIKKAKIFINFMNRANKRVKLKYKYNRIYYLIRAVLKSPHKIFRKCSKGNRYVK